MRVRFMLKNYIRSGWRLTDDKRRSSVLLGEAVQSPEGAHVEFPVGDRRRGSAPILQIVDAKQLPLSAGLDHGRLALFADAINISPGPYRRGEVLAQRSPHSSLFTHFTSLDIAVSANP